MPAKIIAKPQPPKPPKTPPPPPSFAPHQVQFLLTILLVAAAFAIGVLWTRLQYYEKGSAPGTTQKTTPSQAKTPTVSLDTIKALFNDKNISFGDKNSKNLFVEIADPSCPYCHVAAGLNPQLNKQMGFALVSDGGTYIAPIPEMKKLVDSNKAAFVWIYYPGHGNGEMGTKALYCANEQGKFWDVHNKLMTNQGYNLLNNDVRNDKTKSGQLATFLADVFDQTAMKSCLDSGKYDTKLQEDIKTATNLFTYFGTSGTPGFLVNTTPFGGAYSWKDMQSSVK